MADKRFLDLFNKCSFDENEKELFCNARVTRIAANREFRALKVDAIFDRYIDSNTFSALLDKIKDSYNLSSFDINFRYENLGFTLDCWNDIVSDLKKVNPGCNGFLISSEISCNNNVITVTLSHGGSAILKELNVASDLSKLIFDRFGERFTVEFVEGVKPATTPRADFFVSESVPLPQTPPPAKEQKNDFAPKKENTFRRPSSKEPLVVTTPFEVTDEIILGNKIGNNFVLLSENSDTFLHSVTVVGEIFKYDSKPTFDKKSMRCFIYLFDTTNSIIVKMTLPNDKADEVSGNFKSGKCIAVTGDITYDKYEEDYVLNAKTIAVAKKKKKVDNSEIKRVELHLHSNMSAMDATNDIADYVSTAAAWGHKAIAITDHGVLQAYPSAQSAASANGIKMIYGVEGYLVDDCLHDEYIVFDIETTGLNPNTEKITEIGACRVRGGKVVEKFHTMVNPQKPIPEEISRLTGITDDMVKDAPLIDSVLADFIDFCGSYPTLVAHNAKFDCSFIDMECKNHDIDFAYSSIETSPVVQ